VASATARGTGRRLRRDVPIEMDGIRAESGPQKDRRGGENGFRSFRQRGIGACRGSVSGVRGGELEILSADEQDR
jgi:hypothetical protein